MTSILDLAPTILGFLALCGVVGGFFAIKQGYFQQSGTAQSQAISALQAQVEAQLAQIATLKIDLRHQKEVIITIKRLEEKRGVTIDVNGEFVTLIDDSDRRDRTLRIRIASDDLPDGGTAAGRSDA